VSDKCSLRTRKRGGECNQETRSNRKLHNE